MAAFATFAAAEARAVAKVADGTWVTAHAQRTFNGTLAVRVQRKMAPTSATTRQYGAWTNITDDGTV
jgi:hypothetical protein